MGRGIASIASRASVTVLPTAITGGLFVRSAKLPEVATAERPASFAFSASVNAFVFGWPSYAALITCPNVDSSAMIYSVWRSEEHTSELQSRPHLVCRLLLEKKKKSHMPYFTVYFLT